jgi:hypothetical protein
MTTKHQSEFKEGDRVVYHPVGGAQQTSVGVIKKILTHEEEVGTRHATMHASQEEPRYVIENEHTKKETAYKFENIVEKAN